MNEITEHVCRIWQDTEKEFVAVDAEKLNDLAIALRSETPVTPDWQIPEIFPKNHQAFTSHLLFECAADFAFRHFESGAKYEVEGYSGSTAMGRCFFRRFGEGMVIPEYILDMTSSFFRTADFFQGKNLPPLLGERQRNLREVAEVLIKKFGGDSMKVLETGDFKVGKDFWDDGGIVSVLRKNFPIAFGQDYKFHKRSQLFVLMYQGRALNAGGDLPLLSDPENIGPVVDYQVPNGLRWEGVLRYSGDLAERIDSRKIISKDSREEYEIRIATTYAVAELLKKTGWTIVQLDYRLWSMGQKSPYPHHLTPTTFY